MTPAERAEACRTITDGRPCADQLVAHAVEVMDRAMESGKECARKLHANREAKEAGLWKV